MMRLGISSPKRVDNILDCAASLAREPRRRLLYAVTVAEFVSGDGSLRAELFRDHLGQEVELLPRSQRRDAKRSPNFS